MFNDIKPDMTSRMPQYKGDLELINHSAGSLTSQAYHKRWILRNEVLADAAEKASVAAAWMGGRPYPQQRLNNAWTLELGGHFHDTAAGTATPRAYQYCLERRHHRGQPVCRRAHQRDRSDRLRLEHRKGRELPSWCTTLSILRGKMSWKPRSRFPAACPRRSGSYGPDGKESPAQLEDGKVLFLAQAPSVGYAVYHLRARGHGGCK